MDYKMAALRAERMVVTTAGHLEPWTAVWMDDAKANTKVDNLGVPLVDYWAS